MATVDMHITIQAEPREDHWACHVPEFGFTVYGETRAAASLEVNNALQVLLDSFGKDLDAIRRYLESRRVNYSIRPDFEADCRTAVIEPRRVEVSIAA